MCLYLCEKLFSFRTSAVNSGRFGDIWREKELHCQSFQNEMFQQQQQQQRVHYFNAYSKYFKLPFCIFKQSHNVYVGVQV